MYTMFLLLITMFGTILGTPCTNDKTTSDYYDYESATDDSGELTLEKEEYSPDYSSDYYYYIPEEGSTGELTLTKEQCPSGYYYYIPEAGSSGDINVIKE